MAVPCGDHAECVSGAREGGALPPVPPKPPTPKPPTPPPARPRPVTLATPSAAHLAFHEDNVGAISHFGMQARPAPSFASCSVRRSLLMPQVHPGSGYRCGRST